MAYATRSIRELRPTTLGVGGTGFGGLFSPVARSAAVEVLEGALDAGVRHVDTAPFYGLGRSERVVGDVVRGRDELVLSTKVGRLLVPGAHPDPGALGWPDALPFRPVFDYGRDAVLRSFEDSLQRLGTDRIDLVYVHDVGRMTHGEEHARHFDDLEKGGYRALEELRRAGAVGAIGLGVNEVEVCLEALGIGDWDAFLLAGRYTLLEQSALDALLPACASAGTAIVCGGPFNSGVLVGGDTWNYARAPADVVERVARLRAVAADFDVPLPALALQFPLGHPGVASVVPGLRDRTELGATLRWSALELPAGVWDALRESGLIRADAPTPAANPFVDVV